MQILSTSLTLNFFVCQVTVCHSIYSLRWVYLNILIHIFLTSHCDTQYFNSVSNIISIWVKLSRLRLFQLVISKLCLCNCYSTKVNIIFNFLCLILSIDDLPWTAYKENMVTRGMDILLCISLAKCNSINPSRGWPSSTLYM